MDSSRIGSVSHVDTSKIDTIDEVVDRIEVDTTSIESKVDTVDSVVDRIEADTTSIESKVDTIDSIVDDITIDTSKIDDVAVSGLLGTVNSLAYRVHEIERHFHSRDKWFGVAASPSAETHVADRIGGGIVAFTLTAGNNDWGSWVQILGSSDTPVVAGNAYMDASEILITGTNSTNPYAIQIACCESSGLAALVASEQMSEAVYIASTNLFDSGVQPIKTVRIPTGTKVWARTVCVGSNGSTLSFYFGLHEYEG